MTPSYILKNVIIYMKLLSCYPSLAKGLPGQGSCLENKINKYKFVKKKTGKQEEVHIFQGVV